MSTFHNSLGQAQQQAVIVPKSLKTLGFAFRLPSTVIGLGTIPAGSLGALIQAQTKGIKWRSDDDANDGTTGLAGSGTAHGFHLAAGESIYFDGDLAAFKMIQLEATATVVVEFYGE